MKPSTEDFLSASSVWRGSHLGINYELIWHGRSEYSPEGTWCWYLLLPQEQFNADDWKLLRLEREDREFAGSHHRHFNYETFPDVEPHGGWTFGEMETYLSRDGNEYERVKVGCDYAHYFDQEGGYWQRKANIEQDVKRSIELLAALFPNRRERCAYSGRYGDSADFYTAQNGARVRKDQIERLRDGSESWLPADQEADEAITKATA